MKAQSTRSALVGSDGQAQQVRSRARPSVGTIEWERVGGPPLSFGQKLRLLSEACAIMVSDLGPRLRWLLGQSGLLPGRSPEKVDLAAWSPPDTKAAREAEKYLREVSTLPMVNHSLRTYYFSGILYQLSEVKQSVDREALYVASLLHDVGLFQVSPPANEHCFSVGSAREARRIAKDAGWEEARQDKVAEAITMNLNALVPLDEFGPEAHFMRMGGLVDVIAEEWKVHPENLAEILKRFPRDGFAVEAVERVQREVKQNPNGRFGHLNALFLMMGEAVCFS